MASLQVEARERVLYLRAAGPVPLGPASDRLAWALVDACAEVEARIVPPVAVVLACGGDAFFAEPPNGAADCDAAGPVWAEATAAVGRLGPPTVAAIGGDALGPAWELALACDLRVAAPDARIGSPEVRWGRMPAAGGTQRLAWAVGPAVALRLLLLGETLLAPQAQALGLVQRLAPADGLEACLEALLADLRAAAPLALAYAKEAVHAAAELSPEAGLRLEADLAALLQMTDDRREGIAAFLARRAPSFGGR